MSKCRKTVRLNTSHFEKGELVRESALIRCDLDAGHAADHWLRLVTPTLLTRGRTPKQVGYIFWARTDR